MTSTSAIALSGMTAAQTSLQASAHNIANLGAAGFRRQRVDQTAAADGGVSTHELNCEYTPYVWNGREIEGVLCRVVSGSVLFDFADRPIGIANGIETATWIVSR